MINRATPKSKKQLVWEKAAVVPGLDPDCFRKDMAGAIIEFKEYGNRHSLTGWEMDHIWPVKKGGPDFIWNLQPLHWLNNCSKRDNFPIFKTDISSIRRFNIVDDRYWKA